SRAPGQKSLEKAAKNRCRAAKTEAPCAESAKRGGAIGKKPRVQKLQHPPQQSGQLFSVSLDVEPRAAAARYHDAQPHSHRACGELNVQRLMLNV
ncbi:MAG: hypothetical protein WCK55_08100, partial [Verrucomicrobiota bacterium]